MNNEQEYVPSRGTEIFAKICGIIVVGIFVVVPILEYFGNGREFHPRGITVVLVAGLTSAAILALMMMFVFEIVLKRYEWLGKYIPVFCGVTMVSAIPVKDYFEPNIPATFVTLDYSVLVGLIACFLVSAVLVLFRRLRPTQAS